MQQGRLHQTRCPKRLGQYQQLHHLIDARGAVMQEIRHERLHPCTAVGMQQTPHCGLNIEFTQQPFHGRSTLQFRRQDVPHPQPQQQQMRSFFQQSGVQFMSQPVPHPVLQPHGPVGRCMHDQRMGHHCLIQLQKSGHGRALQLRHRAPCLPAPVCLAPLHQQPMGVLASLG